MIKFVKAVAEGGTEVEVCRTGKPIRKWLYVGDFANLVLRVIEARETSLESVNLAQNTGHTVTEPVDAIRAIVGYEREITYSTKFQDGSPKKVMDDRYFRQRFPDFEFTPMETGISKTVEYYRNVL